MLKKVLAGIFLLIGGLFGFFVSLFLIVAWGEWHCGINDFNVGFGSVIAGLCLTVGILLWRNSQPIDKRFDVRNAFWPLWIFGAVILFLMTGLPACPFLSR